METDTRPITSPLVVRLFFALLLLALIQTGEPAAQPVCIPPAVPTEPVPVMTVKIYNNNSSESLYAVFETGPGAEDQWMQAFYQLSATQIEGTKC